MGLLSKALVEALVRAGEVAPEVEWSEDSLLADWLSANEVREDSDALTRYFGLPYRSSVAAARVTEASLAEAPAWPLYYMPLEAAYCCLRPPMAEEAAAFRARYGEARLFLTDALPVHSALLAGALPTFQAETGVSGRVYALEALLRQGTSHVDGMIGAFLKEALRRDATDVHLYMQEEVFCIDFRVHGTLTPYVALPQVAADGLFNKLKLMAEMDIAEHRLPQDGHMQISDGEARYHLRLATLPLLEGEKIVVRILPVRQRLSRLSELGFLADKEALMRGLLEKRQGLLLITGPTNSGKTTTLYACLGVLAASGALVYTIEDPVEAMLPQVQQSQVNARSGYTFAQGLRGILRCDPDVIAVGELRDAETVDIAARAALSGHLVVATLHAHDAHQAVNRLRDLGLSDLLLSAVLLAVVNQRLITKPCEACGGSGTDALGQCCPHCLGSGRGGLRGVQEIWVPQEAARDAIERGASSAALREAALAEGFEPLGI